MDKGITARGWKWLAPVALPGVAAGLMVLVLGSHSDATASGHGKVTVHQSTVEFLGDDGSTVPGTELVFGRVESDAGHCVKGRRVQVYFQRVKRAAKARPDDIARTGQNGYFMAAGDSTDYSYSRLVLQRSKYGPKKHRQVCSGSTLTPIKR